MSFESYMEQTFSTLYCSFRLAEIDKILIIILIHHHYGAIKKFLNQKKNLHLCTVLSRTWPMEVPSISVSHLGSQN